MRRIVLLACLTAGCVPSISPPYLTLIDQRTFLAPGQTQPVADVKDLPALPLATIRFDTPDFDYSPDLAKAIDLAQSRKPDVEFNVVTPVARGAAPTPQAESDAADVARSIEELSVTPDRVHVGLIEDPGNPPREVRVYVR